MRRLKLGRTLGLMVATVVTAMACAPIAHAQPPAAPTPVPPPQIHTSAMEEVDVTPDRATIVLSVETRGKTAAAAGAQNASIQASVLDTLRKLGIDRKQIRTQGIHLSPEYEYPKDGGRPTVVGYQARNSVEVELHQIAQVGTAIDAGLAKGATSVGGLRFTASNIEEARREALGKAITRARADAAAIATAAGGSLGSILEITANAGLESPQPFGESVLMMRAAKADSATPVEAGQIKVSANVTMRFALITR